MTMQKSSSRRIVNATLSDGRSVEVSSGLVCPIGGNVMVHPMMTRSGLNFERSAILAWLEKNSRACPLTGRPMTVSDILPNHALTSQIRGWQKNNGLLVVDASAKPDGTKVTIPPKFICPISSQIMVSPLMTRDGRTYERSAILSWLEKGRGVCPCTGEPLTASALLPNRALEAQIAFWRKNNGCVVIEECHSDNESFVGFLRLSEKLKLQEQAQQQVAAPEEASTSKEKLQQRQFMQQPQSSSFSLSSIATANILSTPAASEVSLKKSKKTTTKKSSKGGRKKFMSRILSAATAELDDDM